MLLPKVTSGLTQLIFEFTGPVFESALLYPHEVGACLDRFLFQVAVHGMVMPATEHNSIP